ncbi:MAG: hypothetical protein Q9196_002919 [Gyalolechia fulgens]
MATMSEEKAAMARARLKKHFDVPSSEHQDRWVDLWNAGDFLPWDRQLPSPALNDLLDQRKDLIGSCFVDDQGSTGTKRRKKALVPGCGAGYDVLLLASYGYDAYGLEVSEKAVQRCVEEQKTNGHKYPVKDEAAGAGSCTFLKGDFFDSAWSKATTAEGTFEFIYDYTLLSKKPEGLLVCLEYPLGKDPATGGPPFGLTSQTYVEHLQHPGEDIPYNKAGDVEERSSSQPSSEALERIDHWQAERSHQIGQGKDSVSVWRHK